jgi:hypothetical protein
LSSAAALVATRRRDRATPRPADLFARDERGTTLVGSIGPKACASDISEPANKLLDAKL